MYISDMDVILETYKKSETYKKPFPVYLVVNKYTVPTSDDDRVFIPRDRLPMIPIPEKPKPMSDGGTDNDH